MPARRPVLPSDLSSRQWEAMERSLTARGFLSARVEDARTLSVLQELCTDIAEGRLSEGEARDRARLWLESAGYEPDDPEAVGTIRDLRSKQRLDTLFDVNVGHISRVAEHNAAQDPLVLDMWPCQELYRAVDSVKKRNWRERWRAAGGRLYGGRMIARKDDPIWMRLSRFGTPFPPFDYNSGMDVRDVDREDAESLGAIERGEEAPEPDIVDPMQGYAVDADGFSADLARDIVELSEGLAELADGVIRWVGGRGRASFRKGRRGRAACRQCPEDGGFMTADGGCNHPNHGAGGGLPKGAHANTEASGKLVERWAKRPEKGERVWECDRRDGVAFLEGSPSIRDSRGREVKWPSRLIDKYTTGAGRRSGKPDSRRMTYIRGGLETVLRPNRMEDDYRGNQRFYYREFDHGRLAIAVIVRNDTNEVQTVMPGSPAEVRRSIGSKYFARRR